LERALGSGDKFVAENEQETVVIQRRCLRAARDIQPGEILTREMIDVLRPATLGAIMPYEIDSVIGLKSLERISQGQELRWGQFGHA
jgi:N-acetylneuraminate synthase